MKLTISLSTKAFEDRVKQMEREVPKQIDLALYSAGQFAISIILDRTEKGMGIDGLFAPYSARYAKAKREGWPATKGRSAFGGDPSGVVNLNVTGEMTSGITATKYRGYTRIGFTNPRASKKAYFNNQKRPFFGLSRGERTRLVNHFKKRLFG